MSPTQAGAIELTATVEGTAPVDIRGSVNPFARELSLDLGAKASDVELPPLTPYAVKYAGYGIQKGKLSMEVHYRLENRKLAASNKLKLDQLTFGERVESPTATKLPVLLAVSLLKDRNGVINLDLPIEGTLDDPQFSVWGLVVQVVVNLIGKAVTAPFALLGSLVGAGSRRTALLRRIRARPCRPHCGRPGEAFVARKGADRSPGAQARGRRTRHSRRRSRSAQARDARSRVARAQAEGARSRRFLRARSGRIKIVPRSTLRCWKPSIAKRIFRTSRATRSA